MIENRRFQTFSVDTREANTNIDYTRSPERRLGAAPPGIQRLRGLLGGAGSHMVKKLLGRHSVSPSPRRLNPDYSAPSTLNNLVHASTNIIARRLERFYSPTNTNNQTTTCPNIVLPISAVASTTLATDRDKTCASCCAEQTPNNPAQAEYDVCNDTEPL